MRRSILRSELCPSYDSSCGWLKRSVYLMVSTLSAFVSKEMGREHGSIGELWGAARRQGDTSQVELSARAKAVRKDALVSNRPFAHAPLPDTSVWRANCAPNTPLLCYVDSLLVWILRSAYRPPLPPPTRRCRRAQRYPRSIPARPSTVTACWEHGPFGTRPDHRTKPWPSSASRVASESCTLGALRLTTCTLRARQ